MVVGWMLGRGGAKLVGFRLYLIGVSFGPTSASDRRIVVHSSLRLSANIREALSPLRMHQHGRRL